jgi:hypothetical protein
MKLASKGSKMKLDNMFERRYGHACPEWIVERAAWAQHTWTQVEEICGNLGFYNEPTEPLPRPVPESHRDEVFENELDYMTPVASELVSEMVGGDAVVTEMPYANNYRTDLAICEIDREALRKRLTITYGDDRSLVDEWKFIKAYRFFRTADPMTYDEFQEDGPYSSASTNKRVWNRLEDLGFLVTLGAYATAVNIPIHITAHAVELKQSDWETAYTQARRAALPSEESDHWAPKRHPKKYGYAHYCWVVLDAGHIDKALEHREKFENGGVGLIGLDKGGAVKLVEPQKFSPPKRSLDLEHLNEKTMEKIDVDDYVNRGGLSRQSDFSEVLAHG